MIKKFFFIVVMAFCFVGRVECFPALTGRVVDDARILTNQQKSDLEQILKHAEPRQVVAVSLSSLDGMEIEEYGYQLGRYWGIGRKGENDGVLVLIAPNERQLRIEVGYGLEHILTDAQSSNIVNHIMLPLARDGKYDESLIQGSVALIEVLNGGGSQKTLTMQQDDGRTLAIIVIVSVLLYIISMIFFGVARAILKKYKTNSRQNRLLFFFYNVLYQNLLLNMIVAMLSGPQESIFLYLALVLVVLYFVNLRNLSLWRKNPKFPYQEEESKGTSRKSSYGFFRGGGSSFRGGGGSFGGGGASGRF